MQPPILPPARLGILGGGQLGRFFVAAASELGYRVWVLDPDPACPAGQIAERHLIAAYDDPTALGELQQSCAAVTTEFENVPAAALEKLAATLPVRPAAAAVAVCQDRRAEKCFLAVNDLPHAPFAVIEQAADLDAADAALFPGILKLARLGYDGKGQALVDDRAAARAAFAAFGGAPCVLEQRLNLAAEISIVLARGADGALRLFPAAENRHRNGILDVSLVPARVTPALRDAAADIARRLAERLGYVGVLGVEFFIADGAIFVNEMAPRPHNSGHYTLDACTSSQYEQQVRALCGLPLADGSAHAAACMVNLLGDLWFDAAGAARQPDWASLLGVAGLKLHVYGKSAARAGRKMAHFTVVDADPVAALARALAARRALGIPGIDDAP